jgi:hypothetical protein
MLKRNGNGRRVRRRQRKYGNWQENSKEERVRRRE